MPDNKDELLKKQNEEIQKLKKELKAAAKPSSMWNKLKGIFCYEIKVELTPYQQKIEDEINEFLHQEITWEGFKNFLFQDVNITFGKNKKK